MGTRSATGTVELKAISAIQNELDDGADAKLTVGKTWLKDRLTNGVLADEINRGLHLEGELASGATVDIDLYDLGTEDMGAGAGKDGLGQDWSCEEVVLIAIKQAGGTGRLEINPTLPTNPVPWIPALTVANGGGLRTGAVFMRYEPGEFGLDVTDGASHRVRLKALGGTASYEVTVLGRHDDDISSSSKSSSTQSATTSSQSSSSSKSSSSKSSSSKSSSSLSSLSSASSSSPSSSQSSSTQSATTSSQSSLSSSTQSATTSSQSSLSSLGFSAGP